MKNNPQPTTKSILSILVHLGNNTYRHTIGEDEVTAIDITYENSIPQYWVHFGPDYSSQFAGNFGITVFWGIPTHN